MASLSVKEMSKYISSYYLRLIHNTFMPNGSFATEWARLRVSRVLDLIGEISDNGRVLDLGCGMGTFTSFLSKIALVVGVDFSKEAMEATRFVVTKYGDRSRVELIRCDIQFLPFRNDIFSKIVAADLIEHLHKEQYFKFQQECYRVLKHNGVLVVYTPNPINVVSPNFYLRKGDPFYPTHIGLRSPIFLFRNLSEGGFRINKFYCVETVYSKHYLSNVITRKIAKTLWVFPLILGGRTCIRAQKVKR